MKTYRLISIIALAFTLMACDDINQLPQDPEEPMPGVVHFKATINTNTPSTRGLSFEGGVLNANWKVGEEIALVYGNPAVKDKATVTSVSNGRATVECDLSGGAANGSIINFYYPYASVVLSNGSYVFDETLIRNQDGTMDYISEKLDWRQATGTLSVNGNSATLQSDVDMSQSLMCVWLLHLKNKGADLNATRLNILMSDYGFTKDPDIASPGASSFYVARTAISGDNHFEFWAYTAENAYLFEIDDLKLAANTFYESTVSLGKVIDLYTLTEPYVAQDTEVLWCQVGQWAQPFQISIADGATVFLKEVDIQGTNNEEYKWSGLTCLGDATIFILTGNSSVCGYYEDYPGIFVPSGKTLTIKGMKNGNLTSQSNGFGAGIGCIRGIFNHDNTPFNAGNIVIESGNIQAIGDRCSAIGSSVATTCGDITIKGGNVQALTSNDGGCGIGCSNGESRCGNITISGGVVTSVGGRSASGIGAAQFSWDGTKYNQCGNILISGGTVTTTGGQYGAGIGCGSDKSKCGTITITSGVTKVKATKGTKGLAAENNIGKGTDQHNVSVCGTITIGGTVYWNGSAYQNGGDTYLTTETLVYP